MLKLILIFRRVLWPKAFLVGRTHFLHLKQQFTYFLKYYPVENGLEQINLLKIELCISCVVLNPVQQKIHRLWIDNVEVIHCKRIAKA